MTSYLWILVLAALAVSRAQDGNFDLDLADAFDEGPTPPPVKPPKAGGDVKPPKAGGDGNFDLDLSDALNPDIPEKPKKPAGDPSKTGDSGNFDISDAFDNVPKKPSGGGGGGGGFDDSDLGDVAGNGDYKPDPGQGGRGGARAGDSTYDNSGGGEQGAAQGGQMAGIISAVGVAILGAASSYFAYQKKKLCFKIQGGADPESGTNQAGTHSEPQVLSNLLKSSS